MTPEGVIQIKCHQSPGILGVYKKQAILHAWQLPDYHLTAAFFFLLIPVSGQWMLDPIKVRRTRIEAGVLTIHHYGAPNFLNFFFIIQKWGWVLSGPKLVKILS